MITLARALRALAVVVAATASTAILLPATALAATTSTATPSTTRVVEASDWAAENLADPFDFANGEDLPPVSTYGLEYPTVSVGALTFNATSGGFFAPIRSMGSIPHGRDSELFPVVASKYSRVSIRMWSGASGPAGRRHLLVHLLGARARMRIGPVVHRPAGLEHLRPRHDPTTGPAEQHRRVVGQHHQPSDRPDRQHPPTRSR